MEDNKEDIRKNYPSLPPNYVSLAQLQERWLQQKQKETEQKKQIASDNQQQPKENNSFNGSTQTSKTNGVGRIPAQGSHVGRSGELRDDANVVFVPRRQSNENHGQIRESKSTWKPKKLGLRDSGDSGGRGMGNAKDKKDNHKKKKGWPRVKKGRTGEDLISENGEISGVLIGKNGEKEEHPGHENRQVHEIVSISTATGLAPEKKGKEGKPVGFSRKPSGKQVVDHQFLSGRDNWTFDAKSRGKEVVDDQFSNSTDKFSNSTDNERLEENSLQKQVVDDQFLNTSDSWTVEAKSRGKHMVNGDQQLEANHHGKEAINGQFLSNLGVEGSVTDYKVEVAPKNGSGDEFSASLRRKNKQGFNTKYERNKRSGNDKGLFGEGNVSMQEALQDNEEKEEEVSVDERRKAGKERLGNRFKRNEGNWRMNRKSNERQPKLGQQELVEEEEDVFMGKKEKTGAEARTGKGAQAYGNKDRVYYGIGKDFGDLSFHDSRKGNSSRGYRQSYGNFGISLHRKEKQVDCGLVWVKKEEKSDTNAEIS